MMYETKGGRHSVQEQCTHHETGYHIHCFQNEIEMRVRQIEVTEVGGKPCQKITDAGLAKETVTALKALFS